MYVTVTAYDNRDRVLSEWSEDFRSYSEASDEFASAVSEAETQMGFDYTHTSTLDGYTRANVNYTDGSATVVTLS